MHAQSCLNKNVWNYYIHQMTGNRKNDNKKIKSKDKIKLYISNI